MAAAYASAAFLDAAAVAAAAAESVFVPPRPGTTGTTGTTTGGTTGLLGVPPVPFPSAARYALSALRAFVHPRAAISPALRIVPDASTLPPILTI